MVHVQDGADRKRREIMNELISKEDYKEILDWHYQMEKGREGYAFQADMCSALLQDSPAKIKRGIQKFEKRP